MKQFPKEFETLLLNYIKQSFLPEKKNRAKSNFNDKDLLFFSKGVKKLSTYFTEDRGSLPPNYLNDPVLRSGYLLYFLPINFLKIVHILNGFKPTEILSGHVRVLDLGCGPGTSSLGLAHYYSSLITAKKIKPTSLDYTLVDVNYHALREAKTLMELFQKSTDKNLNMQQTTRTLDFSRGNISKLLGNFRYHYIIISNALNEIGDRSDKIKFVSSLMNHLDKKNGRLIIIEPALKNPSRDLQSVRDEIVVNAKTGFVQAPCLNQQTCPLNIVNKRDWCHFYADWEIPGFIKKLDKLTGNKNEWLKLAYMVLSLQPREWPHLLKDYDDSWRVISNQMPTKGKKELVVCGPKGRYHLERLDKEKSPNNSWFDYVRRGDVIPWFGATEEYRVDGRARLSK